MTRNVIKPVSANGVVDVFNDVVDAVDTMQERSSTNCDTPLVTRLDSKSLAFICKEHASGQMSIATQVRSDMHKSMHSATDDNG